MQQYCLSLMGLTFYKRIGEKQSPLAIDIIRFVETLGIDYTLSNNIMTLKKAKILLVKDKQDIFNEIMEVFYSEGL